MISQIFSLIPGIKAFSKKMEIISSNIANEQTRNYKAKRAVFEEGVNGGVKVHVELQNKSLPNSNAPREQGQDKSDVDLTREIPHTIITKRGFEANLKALKAEDEILGTLVDIFE